MSHRAIVTATLQKEPIHKTGSSGKHYLLMTLRDGSGDAAVWWTCFVFAEDMIETAGRFQVGEPLSVAGEAQAQIYRPEIGEPRVSLSIRADAILSARRPPNKAKRDDRRPAPTSRDADDNIPF